LILKAVKSANVLGAQKAGDIAIGEFSKECSPFAKYGACDTEPQWQFKNQLRKHIGEID